MTRNLIPKIAIGWTIVALHRQVTAIREEAGMLQILRQYDDLPEQVPQAYQMLVDEIHQLELALHHLEEIARQGDIPLEDLV